MERLKVLMWIVVVVAAGFIIWRVGFYPPVPAPAEEPPETEVVSQQDEPDELDEDELEMLKMLTDANGVVVASDVAGPAELTDVNEPSGADAGEPPRFAGFGERGADGRRPGRREMGSDFARSGRFGGFDERRGFDESPSGRITDVNDANEPMEALNLRNVEMKDVIRKISEWTGKTVIPAEEAEKVRVTIYAPERLPRDKALSHIFGALRMKGLIAEHTDDAIYLTPVKDGKLGFVPTIGADQPLAVLENKDQIVQKFFQLKSHSPAEMGQVVQPLVGEYGYVSADETTRTLLVIDTVLNLMRIERIIVEFDVPEAEQTVTQVFEVRFGDPSEIVQMLNMLLGESQGYSSSRSRSYGRGGYDRGRFGGPSAPSPRTPEQASAAKKADSRAAAATSVVVGSTEGPIVLIPEPRRKWIIARASAGNMSQIEEWIKKLDKAEPVESEYEVVQLRWADPREVEDSIGDGFRNLPGTEFLPSIVVEPLPASKQVLVFGRKDLREMVKRMIAEIDVPPGQFETEHFKLRYADPDQIKTNIDTLYEEGLYGGSSYGRGYNPFSAFGYRGSSRGSSTSSELVRVVSYISLKQVTVIASPENMEKIREQIMQWDAPLDVNEVKPRIVELRNSDPVQLAELLNTLFSETTTSGRMSVMDIMFRGMGMTEERRKIVGPLYGQLTFESVPGTKKIIVISKIPEAYQVVEQLILDLDRQEMGEMPQVITLNYADPEDLAQRLNALFNEPGTTATIRWSEQGLTASSLQETEEGQTGGSSQQGGGGTTTGEYRPWWTTGRQSTNEEPISNVIGRVRFIPDTHSKSILVLAPPEYMENIEGMIRELDIPGKQVIIKAIIMEVDHTDMTSLGLQLSTNPEAFGNLGENAILGLSQLTLLERHGALAFGASGQQGSQLEVGVTGDVYAMIDFLVKKVDAKILNQQTLWTKDNEEAHFFKGEYVAFLAGSTQTVGQATQDVQFEDVGMTLRARPSITPEKNVDMIVNLDISQLTSELVNNQPKRTKMKTTTNMIVRDGETIMLGGILFQKDSKIERKLPLLGDVPLVGGLFRHNEVELANNELLIFITPYVIDEPGEMLPETLQEIERPKERLDDIKKQLQDMREQLEGNPAAAEKGRAEAIEAPEATPQGSNKSATEIAEVYYRSIRAYRNGQLEEAREGFLEVTKSDSIPQPIRDTAKSYLAQIDNRALYAKDDR